MAPRKDDVERLNAKRAAVAEKVKDMSHKFPSIVVQNT